MNEEEKCIFEIYPDRARCEDHTMVTLSFDQPLSDNDLVSVGLRASDSQEYNCLPAVRVNPYTYRFLLPAHEEGITDLMILLNERPIGRKVVTYYSVQTDVTLSILQIYMFLLTQMGDFLKSRNLITEELDRKLCELMNDSAGQQIPIQAFEYLFSVWKQESEPIQLELPTLLHFVAKYGLQELGSVLMDLPDSHYPCRIRNLTGLTPAELSRMYGHRDLSQLFDKNLSNNAEEAGAIENHCGGEYSLEHSVTAPGEDNVPLYAVSCKRSGQPSNVSRQDSRSESIYMAMQGGSLNTIKRAVSDGEAASRFRFGSPITPRNNRIGNSSPDLDNTDSSYQEMNSSDSAANQSEAAEKHRESSLERSEENCRDPQLQLVNIMEKVKRKELTIEEAVERFKDWKSQHSTESNPSIQLPTSGFEPEVDGRQEPKSAAVRLTMNFFKRSASSHPVASSNESSTPKSNKSYTSSLKKLKTKWTRSQQSLAIPENEATTATTLPDIKQLFDIAIDDSSPRSSTASSTSRESCNSCQSTSGVESADDSKLSTGTLTANFDRTPSRSSSTQPLDANCSASEGSTVGDNSGGPLSPPPLPPRAGTPGRVMGPGQTFSLDRSYYSRSKLDLELLPAQRRSVGLGARRSLEQEDLYDAYPSRREEQNNGGRKGSLQFILETNQSTLELSVKSADQSDDDASCDEYIEMSTPQNASDTIFNNWTSPENSQLQASADDQIKSSHLNSNLKLDNASLLENSGTLFAQNDKEIEMVMVEDKTPTNLHQKSFKVRNDSQTSDYDIPISMTAIRERISNAGDENKVMNCTGSVTEKKFQNKDITFSDIGQLSMSDGYLSNCQQMDWRSPSDAISRETNALSFYDNNIDIITDLSKPVVQAPTVMHPEEFSRNETEYLSPGGDKNDLNMDVFQLATKPPVPTSQKNQNPPAVKSKPPPPKPPCKKPALNSQSSGGLE